MSNKRLLKSKIPENLIDFDKVYNPYKTPASKLTIRERFFLYVKKLDDGCWEWSGAMWGKRKEPELGIFKYPYKAKRISYAMYKEDFDPLMQVKNICDNNKCVNPEHLICYYGRNDLKYFVRDVTKHPFYASNSGGLFITQHQFRRRENYLIEKLNDIGVSYSMLAEVFNVDQSLVSRIITDEINPKGRGKNYYRSILNNSMDSILDAGYPVNSVSMSLFTLLKLYKETSKNGDLLEIYKEQFNKESVTKTTNRIRIWSVDIIIDNSLKVNKMVAATEERFEKELQKESSRENK